MDIARMRELAEGTEGVDQNKLAQIRRATSRNDHQGALILGATALGATLLQKQFELIKQLHDIEGYMPLSLRAYCDECYDKLMLLAKQKLSAEAYKSFYSSF